MAEKANQKNEKHELEPNGRFAKNLLPTSTGKKK
jgi:hypothetical protein